MDKKMLKQKKTGQIIVISAPSGAGKGTVIGKLLERDNKSRWLSVSATSRKPREGEEEGVNYYYLTEDDFKEKIDDNFFLEYTNYAGNYYGTPKKYIKEKKYIENRRFICSTCSKALIFLCFQGLDGGTDVDRSSLASSPLTCSRTSGYSESGFMEY